MPNIVVGDMGQKNICTSSRYIYIYIYSNAVKRMLWRCKKLEKYQGLIELDNLRMMKTKVVHLYCDL